MPDREPADDLVPELLVRCTGAALTFGSGPRAVVAVHGTDLELRVGQRLVIRGPSGSGKSSLLHLIAGLEQPTSGTVTRAPGLTPHQIGLIFQGESLIPTLDIRENTALPLLLAGEPEVLAHPVAMVALGEVGIHELGDRLPDELSGGQAQRAAVARVLARRPRLILADEPTGRLDHRTGARVLDALAMAADRSRAALVVTTHDPSVAARFPDCRVMRAGRLIEPEEAS